MRNGEAAELRKERLLLWILAAIQFTHILDFMIVMPLGPRFMEIFAVAPSRFGFMVSGYSYSAGLAGMVAALFIDRFDRKQALLVLYAGFALGTLACALAPTFPFLVAARLVTGAFGGVVSATVLTVIGDAIHPRRRGAAMGTVFTSFSLASIAGVPFGLFLANHLGWHAPFFLLAGLSTLILPVARAVLPPLPLPAVLIATSAFMVFTSGRMVPGMAMITSSVAPRMRGGFMNMNSAFQLVASGLAAMIGGAIIAQGPGGTLERYVLVGLLGSACVLGSLLLARKLRPAAVASASEPGPASLPATLAGAGEPPGIRPSSA